jgi:hypothetical protein
MKYEYLKFLPFLTNIQNKNLLNIYCAKKWDDIYELMQIAYFKDNTARCAGNLFQIGDKLICPAQDCNDDYMGKG